MELWNAWWAWALMAAFFAILELILPGYVLMGFGIGAGAVAAGLLVGLGGPLVDLAGGYAPALLVVAFGVVSGIAWGCIRAIFGAPGSVKVFDEDIND